MKAIEKAFLALTLFLALIAIKIEGLGVLIFALLAAISFYFGLPDASSVRGEPEDSNQSTNELEAEIDKEKQSDQ